MIDFLVGTVKFTNDNRAVILAGNIGFSLTIPQTRTLEVGKEATLFTYLHWSSENGPSLFGFCSEMERTLFLLIIECPQIGPKIAITILSNITPEELVNALIAEDEKKLSSVHGIGEKKAQQMIITLKRKITKLLASGELQHTASDKHNEWNMVSEALLSLGYSRQEIGHALAAISKEEAHKGTSSFDYLMRKTLAHLASNSLRI